MLTRTQHPRSLPLPAWPGEHESGRGAPVLKEERRCFKSVSPCPAPSESSCRTKAVDTRQRDT
ncbi:hypothetical protein E2C01_044983 [Portunus trituberculatus]|uniref:Uncharacterized protein n=1 Tax=Portunus trituberculatus TaxID=210409 RepID=A0A5B7G3T9_PORTR|nr:hypothetical protein [Portunus trituberculatus]